MKPTGPTPLYLCLRVPEFAAQALVRLRPALRATAVAVLEGEPPLEKVCAATLPARRVGVRHGMTRAEAESFPHLVLLRRSAAEEESAAAALVEMSARFTPRLQELARTAAFDLALDMTGSERMLGSARTMGQKLLRAARELGFSARTAASANLPTAVCLVRAGGDTLLVVPPGEEAACLKTVALHALDPGAELADTLAAWGLRTAGELAALPAADVMARLGAGGSRLHVLARGEAPHLFVPLEPVLALHEYIAFDDPVDNLESLLFVLGPMLDQLILRARQRALLLAAVTVRLHLERSEDERNRDRRREVPDAQNATAGPTHERTLKPALPVNDRTLLLKLLQLDLQTHPAPAAVVGITLQAEPGPRPGVQSGLFSPQLPEPMRLEVTLARIAALVGEGRVGRAVLQDTHQPESFHMHRLALQEETNRKKAAPLRALDTVRTGVALRRVRPPKPVQVWQNEGRLAAFAFQEWPGKYLRYTVQRALGPWRQSGHWWSGAAWSREEWDVDAAAEDGSRLHCVLTHDLLCTQWRMEAMYD